MTRLLRIALILLAALFVPAIERAAAESVTGPLAVGPARPAAERPSFAAFLRSALQTSEPGASAGRADAVALVPPRPAPRPGPQPDIRIRAIASGEDLDGVLAAVPELSPPSVDDSCRADWIDRCRFLPEDFAERLTGALADAGVPLAAHREPYFYVSRLGADGRFLVSREAIFTGGGIDIANAVVTAELGVERQFSIVLSPSEQGFDAGGTDAGVAVLAALRDASGIYLTVDTSRRCADRPRRAGLLLKVSEDYARVLWVSPFGVSDTNVVLRDGRIYAASGGSCESDYLFELDPASGAVTGRMRLPTAARLLALEDDILILPLESSAVAYRFTGD